MTELWRRSAFKPKPGLSIEAEATPRTFEAAEPGRGRLAHAPHHIPMKGWKDVAWRTYQEIGRDKLPAVAGRGHLLHPAGPVPGRSGSSSRSTGCSPTSTRCSSSSPRWRWSSSQEVVDIVGDQMVRLADAPASAVGLAFLISLLLSVWSANAGMKALFDGLNIAYDEEREAQLRAAQPGPDLRLHLRRLVFPA